MRENLSKKFGFVPVESEIETKGLEDLIQRISESFANKIPVDIDDISDLESTLNTLEMMNEAKADVSVRRLMMAGRKVLENYDFQRRSKF